MQPETPAPDFEQSSAPNQELPGQPPRPQKRKAFWIALVIIIVALAVLFSWWFGHPNKASAPAATVTSQSSSSSTNNSDRLTLNPSKNYGNKYADDILPVGDGKYTASSAKQGYVYACSGYAQNLAKNQGGAMTPGPWFTDNNTEYNASKKLHVEGSVVWTADFNDTVNGTTRTIVTNDLPNHPTGIFPILSSDPAYAYDRNPNSIESQNFTMVLPADPTYSNTPYCESGTVGVMNTGVMLFNALDAGGRDAGAWEVQDNCDGHPQMDGIYHYHTLSSCIKDIKASTVIGWALDGYPITGPEVSSGNVLTTADLDECHGITSQVYIDGKAVMTYHYVMTQNFPYSINCFRAKPITPPGQNQTSNQTKSQTPPVRQ